MRENDVYRRVLFYQGYLFLIFFLPYFLVSLNAHSQNIPLEFTHYTTEDGLRSSYVKSIVQDVDGFIWIAQRHGVSRYDGEKFREFPAYNEDNKPIEFFCDKLFVTPDSILIGSTLSGKYYYYDSNKECFFPYTFLDRFVPIEKLLVSPEGMWLKKSGSLFRINTRNGQLKNINDIITFPFGNTGVSIKSFTVNHGWLIFISDNHLFCYNLKKDELITHDFPARTDFVQNQLIFLDSKLNLWLSFFNSGILKLNIKSKKEFAFSKDKQGNAHIPDNFVHCFTEDHYGRVWIGTEAGLAVWNDKTETISSYNHKLSDPKGLNTDPIYNAYCDRQGNVWLGTYWGGVNFWNNEKSFFQMWGPGVQKNQLSGNVVRCFAEDNAGNLWVGLEDNGVNKYNPVTGKFTCFSTATKNNQLTNNNIHDLLFVNDHDLWIATYMGGINVLNTQTNDIRYFTRENTPNLWSNDICMMEKYKDLVYLATYNGIFIYSLSDKNFSALKPNVIGKEQFFSICITGDTLWFSSRKKIYQYFPLTDSLSVFDKIPEMQSINFVKSDSKGRIWVGSCFRGLCCYDRVQDKIMNFNPLTGFPAHWIFSLEEGENGWFWAGTDKGLVNFNPERQESKNIVYENNSDIPLQQFNYTASFTDSKGNVFLGGTNGMISFNKAVVPSKKQKLSVVFTEIRLFNRLVLPGELKNFNQSINKVKELRLRHNQNIISLGFSVLNYSSSEKGRYAYYLEGFEKKWNAISDRNLVTYTNLNPGKYTFKVRAYLKGGQFIGGERSVKIVVLPPFWLTWWAFGIYSVWVVFIVFLIYYVGRNLEKSKSRADFEYQEKIHAEEIYQIKMNFFTNISHELKTPLMLILGPANKILEKKEIKPAIRKKLNSIQRNAERLFSLINQLLDFQKIESNREYLRISNCNLTRFSEEITNSFQEIAKARKIHFHSVFPEKEENAYIDMDKIDKIVFNLLSNAFKFTPAGGEVCLTIELKSREQESNQHSELIITVSDTGKGIKAEEIDKIFDRYYQGKDNPCSSGAGIGLSYVKSLVQLHHGTINVNSVETQGASFRVKVPVSKSDYSEKDFCPVINSAVRHDKIQIYEERAGKNDLIDMDILSTKPHILIVEDNVELLDFLKESLEPEFKVTTAYNGEDALEKLKKFSPELIISDIMMPKMDGIELTVHLKTGLKTSHIPVILLTSKSGTENKLKGLSTGADFYIEKPFYPQILKQNIKNILNTRKNITRKFKSSNNMAVEELAIPESDKDFLEKTINIIKQNISNQQFDVNYLIKEMRISRTLLHVKLKSILNCSSTEFIRAIRLKEALKLISSGKCNITEAAYETGFSSPQYFSKCFREFFGKSPSDYFN